MSTFAILVSLKDHQIASIINESVKSQNIHDNSIFDHAAFVGDIIQIHVKTIARPL